MTNNVTSIRIYLPNIAFLDLTYFIGMIQNKMDETQAIVVLSLCK